MNSSFRKFLTLVFLLAFSFESLAATIVPSEPGKFTTYSKVDVQRDNLSPASWISEANEESSDDKIHGIPALPPVDTHQADYSFISKIKPDFQESFGLFRHQQILRMICRLTI